MLNLNEREEKILGAWKAERIVQKLKERNKGRKKFYFLDGPPNAYGLATHHMWVYAIKDLVTKYKRFAGFDVHDRGGFDVHGLPIENKIERSLNLASKDEIETKVGVANFVKACKDYVDKEMAGSIELLKRFGVTMDWDTYYVPYKSAYISKGWEIFKKMHDKGLLYKDLKPMAYCARCGTVLSTQGPEVEYADEKDNSIFVRYKVRSSPKLKLPENTYLVIWTTTPWTLPAHMAIAVNPNVEYVVAEVEGFNYIVAKERLDVFTNEIGKSNIVRSDFMGSELEGTLYSSPLEGKVPTQKRFNKYHRVLLDEHLVSVSEGTGLLHVAPGHGPEDYLLAKRNKIPVFSPVDMHAKYTEEAGAYKGISILKEANEAVLADLKASGDLLFSGTLTHTYPHCWRCHSKLIFLATPQWFINIGKIKRKMLKQNEKITWYPQFAQKWFADAIESSPDWCISRQRYWGAPLPIWICEQCKEMEVIGSVKELAGRAGLQNEPTDMELHKPHIDAVTLKCKKCSGTMKRVVDTVDVWYESGIAHTASLSDDEFARLYPADYITESLDQIRGWFSTLLRTGVAAHGKTPFKSVTIGGMMKDEFGEEVHRSHGNAVSTDDLLKITSVDGWRLFVTSKPRYLDLKLKKDELREANNHIIMLYNISELIKEFSALSEFNLKEVKKPSMGRLRNEDLWILSRLNTLIEKVTKDMDAYAIDEAVGAMRNFFIEDFSRFYLKFAKQRAAEAGKGELKRIANLTGYILRNLVIMLSIATPFSCEYIYRELFAQNGESVLLAQWPKSVKRMADIDLEKDMEIVKDSITALLNSREKAGISLRWPVATVSLEVTNDDAYSALQRLSTMVENYVNAKKLELKRVSGVKEEVRPIFAKLGPSFKEKAGAAASALKNTSASEVRSAIDRQGYYHLDLGKDGHVEILPEHFTIVQGVEEGDAVLFKYGKAFVDKNIPNELKEEAFLREFERHVQLARKELNLKKTDKIELGYEALTDMQRIIDANMKKVKRDLNAASIRQKLIEGTTAKELDLGGALVKISVKKVED